MPSTNPSRKHGFTLVELLVVVGIIALLIGILLPALQRARDQARTVACASNQRQLYNAIHIYSTVFNGYCMPARIWSGVGATTTYWCGKDVLAPLFGVQGANGQDAANKVAQMLDCPSNERPKDPASGFSIDYTYNTSLGDDRAHPGSPQFNPARQPWAFFKKMTQIRPHVIISLDATESPAIADYERFEDVDDLTYSKFYAGWPHQNNRTNIMFFDGSVRLVDLWVRKPVPVAPTAGLTAADVHPQFKNELMKYPWLKEYTNPF
jgi:prepilin-type N-terminal cleavage/methylation domain-containing protein/prepilin-type processing-associated H-X9-DG protein